MGSESDVLRIKRKIDKMASLKADQSEAHELLKVLEGLPIDLTILTKTRIGMSVNALRKASNDEEVIQTAKNLIRNWKKAVGDKKDADKDSKDDKKKDKNESSNSKAEKSPPQDSNGSGPSNLKEVFPKAIPTSDGVRLKCREMLANAIKHLGELPDGTVDSPESLAEQVEEAIYGEYKNTESGYKTRIRSRIYNLKDAKNPGLRENLLTGQITPKRLATMTADEIASAEMKALREKFTKESIDDHQLAVAQGTKTDLLKCGKCNKRDCVYNQMQTRSADEPMTTFVLCNHCGNRWKFC